MATKEKVAVVATLTCRAGQRDAAAAAFQPYLDNVKAEDGTQLYILHAKDETTLLIYELYRDEAAAKDHTAGMRKLAEAGKALGKFLAAPTKIERLAVIGGKGPSAPSKEPVATAEIAVGSRLPDATFYVADADFKVSTLSTSDVFAGKRVALFAVPGPFTSGCTKRHLPGYVTNLAAFKQKGVDAVVCVAVADAFVMHAWREANKVPAELVFLADPNAQFTQACGLGVDMSAIGLGLRSTRYALLVENGVVRSKWIDADGRVKASGADNVLARL